MSLPTRRFFPSVPASIQLRRPNPGNWRELADRSCVVSTKNDPLDPTVFRFRGDNTHNRDMLEYRAEVAMHAGNPLLAAAFAQAAALYAIAEAINTRGDSAEGLG